MNENQGQPSNELKVNFPCTVKTVSLRAWSSLVLKELITMGSLVLIDLVSIGLVLLLAIIARVNLLPLIIKEAPLTIPPEFTYHVWWMITIWLFCIAREGLYVKRMPFWSEAKRVVQATFVAFLFTMAIVALAKLSDEVSRTTLVIAFTAGLLILPFGRYLGKKILSKIGLWNEPVLIMGAGQTGMMIAHSFQDDMYIGYKVIGFLDDDPAKKRKGVIISGQKYNILGGFADAPHIIAEKGIREVILAAPGIPGTHLVDLSNQLRSFTHSFMVVPDLIGMSVVGGDLDYLSNDQIVAYRTHNNLADPINIILKNLFDLVMGMVIFLVTIPFLVLLSLLIKLDSPGPVIYSGERLGRYGKAFKCYKFRTMYLNNEEILEKHLEINPDAIVELEKYAKLKGDDPRVTRIGKFLRRISFDELPQIFNVLLGEMSLVGARPYLFSEKGRMGDNADTILMTKPGMTGLWQVSGRNEVDFEGRVAMETWYIRNWSLWLDISLLIRTVGVVLQRKGAY